MLFIFGILFSFLWAHTPAEKVVECERAYCQSIDETFSLIGTVEPKKCIVFKAKTNGVIDCSLPSGVRAKKGDLIIKIENKALEESYKMAKEALKIATDQYQRARRLQKKETISQQDLEDKYVNVVEAKKNISLAKISFDQICYVAPFDGIVGTYRAKSGSYVDVNEVMVSFFDLSSCVVKFNIPEHAVLKLDPYGWIEGKKYPLHVQYMIDPKTHSSPAFISYTPKNRLVGSSLYVTLKTKKRNNAIVIPQDALFFFVGAPHVYVVKDSKATLRAVSVGIREKERVEITKGLKEGDLYIKVAPHRLYPDCPVKIK